MKTEERQLARRLRSELGLPVKEIADRVGVSVSSVSIWVRDVPLSPEQEAALNARNPVRNGQLTGALNNSRRCRGNREAAQGHGRRLAQAGDALHRGGCMLYWAEGSKRRNVVLLSNSDPDLLTVFRRFLRDSYGVVDEQIALTVNCHLGNGLTIDDVQDWWLTRLELPALCLRAPSINRVSSASKRRKGHILPYGTACLGVYSTFIVQSIYGAIQEYSGIDRPEWLDL